MIALVALLAACSQETVAHRQSEREANRMVRLLLHAGIASEKLQDLDSRAQRFDVRVPYEDRLRALDILEAYNLPQKPQPDSAKLIETSSSLIPTASLNRARREVGIRGDLVNQLMRWPQVVDVFANVSVPEKRPLQDLNEPQDKHKVAVALVLRGKPPFTQTDVRSFVHARVPEVRAEDVQVTMMTATALATPEPQNAKTCAKASVMGLQVCADQRTGLGNMLLLAALIAALMGAVTVIAILKAFRYRQELTQAKTTAPR